MGLLARRSQQIRLPAGCVALAVMAVGQTPPMATLRSRFRSDGRVPAPAFRRVLARILAPVGLRRRTLADHGQQQV